MSLRETLSAKLIDLINIKGVLFLLLFKHLWSRVSKVTFTFRLIVLVLRSELVVERVLLFKGRFDWLILTEIKVRLHILFQAQHRSDSSIISLVNLTFASFPRPSWEKNLSYSLAIDLMSSPSVGSRGLQMTEALLASHRRDFKI